MADITDFLRSPEGLRKGGHTRPEGSTNWGTKEFIAPSVTGKAEAQHTVIGDHSARTPKPLQPGASEAAPKGQKQYGAPVPRVAAAPAGMKGRR